MIFIVQLLGENQNQINTYIIDACHSTDDKYLRFIASMVSEQKRLLQIVYNIMHHCTFVHMNTSHMHK